MGSKCSRGQTEGAKGRVLVAGASGFVGRRLCPALVNAGFEVRAMTRRPSEYRGAGEAVGADASDVRSLRAAMQNCVSAYYLVHSLARADFQEKDAAAARAFGEAAADKGVGRIIYLGGLGTDKDDLSAHLRSRRQVEALLALAGVPVTTLRAGIIIGYGGISWEITRQLVEHLPAMVCRGGSGRGHSRLRWRTSSGIWSASCKCPRRPGGSSTSAARMFSPMSKCCVALLPWRGAGR